MATAAAAQSCGENATLALLLAAWGCAALCVGRTRLRGTTLLAPWAWALTSLTAIAGAEIGICWGGAGPGPAAQLRFMAAATTFCPLMAVLGAKRPQDRAWQWVVASLWLIVAWPALESLLARPEQPLRLHPARQWFQLLLWLIGVFNGLPTRRWWAAACGLAGQFCLLADHWPLVAERAVEFLPAGPQRAVFALALLAISLTGWAWNRPRGSRPAAGWDRVWLDFRDEFGAVWALRVLERFNTAAITCGWNLRLHWSGFGPHDLTAGSAQLDDHEPARQAFLQLLRRFVSPEWIETRRRNEQS